jgi:SAGA-associated factor 29
MQSDNDITMTEEEENEDENWILAEVIAHPSSGKYDVEDVDTEDGHCSYTLSKKCVVPLPLWRANPITDEMCIFKVGSIVLALYPQTTCFYRGLVNEIPSTPQDDYFILFEDNTYPEGYSPPLQVPQLYVVAYNDFKK